MICHFENVQELRLDVGDPKLIDKIMRAFYYFQFSCDNIAFTVNIDRWNRGLLKSSLMQSTTDSERALKQHKIRRCVYFASVPISLCFYLSIVIFGASTQLDLALTLYHSLVMAPLLVTGYVSVYRRLMGAFAEMSGYFGPTNDREKRHTKSLFAYIL